MLSSNSQSFLPRFFLVLLLALALSACGTTQTRESVIGKEESSTQEKRSTDAKRTRGFKPIAHVWANLTSYGGEENGFATYTYVLTGRDSTHKQSWSRYTKLIDAIRSSTAQDTPKLVDKSMLNLFLIPVTDNKDTRDPSAEPNDKLSIELLTALSISSPPGPFGNPGPFLVSLNKPIRYGERGEIANVLYLDCSKMNDKTMRELVRRYKSAVIKPEGKSEKKFDSWEIEVLNTALAVEDSYGFVKVAFAELHKAFNSSGSD